MSLSPRQVVHCCIRVTTFQTTFLKLCYTAFIFNKHALSGNILTDIQHEELFEAWKDLKNLFLVFKE